MMEAMEFWVRECDIDGFRCDMAMLVPLDFWRNARIRLDKIKKLGWLAECEEIAYHQVFDISYAWKFLHRMEAVWRKEFPSGPAALDEVLLDFYDRMFPASAIHAYFTSNHDENSHSGSEYERMGDGAKAFAVLCCTWNGLPLIYSGQEMPNYKRLDFFDKDTIPWTGDFALHGFYKKLLDLRKRNPALRAGDPTATTHRLRLAAPAGNCFAFVRRKDKDEVLVILNLSADALSIPAAELLLKGSFSGLFTGNALDPCRGGNDQRAALGLWGLGKIERLTMVSLSMEDNFIF